MKLEEEYMGERVPAEGSVGAISYLDLICQSGKRDPKIVVNWCAPNPFLSPYRRSLWTQFSPSSNPSPLPRAQPSTLEHSPRISSLSSAPASDPCL